MKKILLSFIAMSCLFMLTACGGGGTTHDTSVTPKLGDTIIMDGFEITLVNYTLGKAIDEYEEYQDLVYLDVQIKNTGLEANIFSDNLYTLYSPNNTALTPVYGPGYIHSIDYLGSIRSGGLAEGQIIFPFVGYGTYYIEVAGINGTVTAEIDVME